MGVPRPFPLLTCKWITVRSKDDHSATHFRGFIGRNDLWGPAIHQLSPSCTSVPYHNRSKCIFMGVENRQPELYSFSDSFSFTLILILDSPSGGFFSCASCSSSELFSGKFYVIYVEISSTRVKYSNVIWLLSESSEFFTLFEFCELNY